MAVQAGAAKGAQPAGPNPEANWGAPAVAFPQGTPPRPLPLKGISNDPPPTPSLFKKYPEYLYISELRFLATLWQTSKVGVGGKGGR